MRASARFVGPLERILYLKSLPNFSGLPGGDLAALAQFLEERRFKRGEVVIPDDRPVEALHFVVEGRLKVAYGGVPVAVVEPPWGAGFLGLLSRKPNGTLAVAETDTLSLVVPADAIMDLLEDHFALLHGALGQLCRQLLRARDRLPDGDPDVAVAPDGLDYPNKPLDLVERLVWIRQHAKVFQRSNLDALAELCKQQTEVRLEPGTTMWRAGEEADYGLSIVYGRVRCGGGEAKRTFWAGEGFTLGMLDGIGSLPRFYDAVTETRLIALRNDVATMIGVLEDNFELAMDLLSANAASLLEVYSQVGPD